MANYENASVKLKSIQLKKLKSATKNKAEITSRIIKKKVSGWEVVSWIISYNKTKK